MEKYRFLQPVEEMEHISRAELGERFDEILESCEKDNVGFVITDCGKNDVVLCPAHWIDFRFDDDFGCIINCAVRYALGRNTYMPGLVCDFVRKYMSIFDAKTIDVIIQDIDRDLEFCLDQKDLWISLKNDLLKFRETRGDKIE